MIVNDLDSVNNYRWGVSCTHSQFNLTEQDKCCKEETNITANDTYMTKAYNYTPASSFFFFENHRVYSLDENASIQFDFGNRLIGD